MNKFDSNRGHNNSVPYTTAPALSGSIISHENNNLYSNKEGVGSEYDSTMGSSKKIQRALNYKQSHNSISREGT